MQWAIDSGWFLISIISSAIGIFFAILKSIDIIRNWRKSNRREKKEQIEKLSQTPKEIEIHFVFLVFDCADSTCSLSFDVVNIGDFNTTVYLKHVAVLLENLRFDTALSLDEKFDIKSNDKKNISLPEIFFEPKSKECYVEFLYSYLNNDGKEITKSSKPLRVRKK